MANVEHPNVVALEREMIFERGQWRHILVVVTDLPLAPDDADYDSSRIDAMVKAVFDAATGGPGYHSLVIRNSKGG